MELLLNAPFQSLPIDPIQNELLDFLDYEVFDQVLSYEIATAHFRPVSRESAIHIVTIFSAGAVFAGLPVEMIATTGAFHQSGKQVGGVRLRPVLFLARVSVRVNGIEQLRVDDRRDRVGYNNLFAVSYLWATKGR